MFEIFLKLKKNTNLKSEEHFSDNFVHSNQKNLSAKQICSADFVYDKFVIYWLYNVRFLEKILSRLDTEIVKKYICIKIIQELPKNLKCSTIYFLEKVGYGVNIDPTATGQATF